MTCGLCRHEGLPLQRCGQCSRWFCQTCYVPWQGLTCPLCRHPASGRRRHLEVVR